MTYATARLDTIREAYRRRAHTLATQWKQDKTRPLAIILPGGMGSQLRLSHAAWSPSSPAPAPVGDVRWVRLKEILSGAGDALDLAISQGEDVGHKVIFPDGRIETLLYAPYGRLRDFLMNTLSDGDGPAAGFRINGVSARCCVGIFGFDWRRPIDEGAMLLDEFLTMVREEARDAGAGDPLRHLWLFAHSQGGLVLKTFLNLVADGEALSIRTPGTPAGPVNASPWDRGSAITIATPFYGTSTHMRRYWLGERMLNSKYGAERMARLISGMPGPYILLKADRGVLTDSALAALTYPRTDPPMPYPVRDASTGGPADPFSPAMRARWPRWAMDADGAGHLSAAAAARAEIDRDLPDDLIDRVFCIRGVMDKGTVVGVEWSASAYGRAVPSDTTFRYVLGAGDGTVPAWSSVLRQLAEDPVRSRRQTWSLRSSSDHQSLADVKDTFNALITLGDQGSFDGIPDYGREGVSTPWWTFSRSDTSDVALGQSVGMDFFSRGAFCC